MAKNDNVICGNCSFFKHLHLSLDGQSGVLCPTATFHDPFNGPIQPPGPRAQIGIDETHQHPDGRLGEALMRGAKLKLKKACPKCDGVMERLQWIQDVETPCSDCGKVGEHLHVHCSCGYSEWGPCRDKAVASL